MSVETINAEFAEFALVDGTQSPRSSQRANVDLCALCVLCVDHLIFGEADYLDDLVEVAEVAPTMERRVRGVRRGQTDGISARSALAVYICVEQRRLATPVVSRQCAALRQRGDKVR